MTSDIKISFEYELTSEEPTVHGLDMGHLTVQIGSSRASSKERNQSNMVFLTATMALDALATITERGGRFTILGIDSSFELDVESTKESTVVFRCANTLIGEVSSGAAARALWRDTSRFVEAHRDRFVLTDATSAAIFDDLAHAMRRLGANLQAAEQAERRPSKKPRRK